MKNLAYLFVLFLLIGCKPPKPLEIEIDQLEPKLVVSSQVIPNQFMVVSVSRSFSALEFSGNGDAIDTTLLNKLLVDSALVTISYGDQVDTLNDEGNGIYTSISTPQFQSIPYTLTVRESGTEREVTATSEMLSFVGFDSVVVSKKENEGVEFVEVFFRVDDPLGNNWYMINFYAADTLSNSNQNPFNAQAIPSQTFAISDKEYQQGELKGFYKLYDWESDTMFVSVSNIDEGYYDYLIARQRSENSFGGFLSEPVSFPTNVKGGFGYFSTHFPDVRVFEVK